MNHKECPSVQQSYRPFFLSLQEKKVEKKRKDFTKVDTL